MPQPFEPDCLQFAPDDLHKAREHGFYFCVPRGDLLESAKCRVHIFPCTG